MISLMNNPPSLLPTNTPDNEDLIEIVEKISEKSNRGQRVLTPIPEKSEKSRSDIQIVLQDDVSDLHGPSEEEKASHESSRRSSSSHLLAPVLRTEVRPESEPEPEPESFRQIELVKQVERTRPVESQPLVPHTGRLLKLYGEGSNMHHRIETRDLGTLMADQLVVRNTYLLKNGRLTGERIERTVYLLHPDVLYKSKKDRTTSKDWQTIQRAQELNEAALKQCSLQTMLRRQSSVLVLNPETPYILRFEMKKFCLPGQRAKSEPGFFARLINRLACCLPGRRE